LIVITLLLVNLAGLSWLFVPEHIQDKAEVKFASLIKSTSRKVHSTLSTAGNPNGTKCKKKLAKLDLDYKLVKDRTNSRGCKLANAVSLSRIGEIKLPKSTMLSCEMATNLAEWLEKSVQPQATRILGQKVTRLHHLGTYNCRTMRGSSSRLSQHAFANAIDVSAFSLADGTRVPIQKNWDGQGKKSKFWKKIRTKACKSFDLVLSPDFNAAHHDHLHLDAGYYQRCL
jgi:hypothetical protein